jgi:predicted nucleic acid-binding protein
MKVYLDTNIISALAKHDMPELTSRALMKLLDLSNMATFKLVTSEVARREIEKLEHLPPDPSLDRDKWILGVMYRLLEKVEFIEDHTVLGFHNQWDRYGGVSYPLVQDDPTSSALRQIGLDRTDAHHLMLAIRAGCQVFLTCDKRTILNRRHEIESRFPTIKLKEPTELLTDLTSGKSPA